jgi:UDP-N-acetylglucosamine--N-acetylmuramyl-(pentapeptide) pyrophosphoryl-undecaprenol N-acetylglucosamine transferase
LPALLPAESRFAVAIDIPSAFETWAQSLIDGRGPVLMVADSGGHLQELVWLDRVIPSKVPRIWISSDTEMSRSLLQSKNDVRLQSQRIFPRRFDTALRVLPSVVRTLRETKPRAIISTGPAIAVPWLAVARLMRIPAVFIESATSVTRHGLTGILLDYIPGVYKFSQTGHCTKGWGTAPNVFDLVVAPEISARPTASAPHVFVTVGSNRYPFDRLIRRLDAVLPRSWPITWQISGGDAAYRPTRGRVERFLAFSEMQQLFRTCDIVICHAGVGSTMSALEHGQRPIVVPRSARHGEHVDDHQHDLAQYLKRFPTIAVRAPDEISVDTLRP